MKKHPPYSGKIYHDALLCSGCGEMYFDDEECFNGCFICEFCLEWTMLQDIDAGLLMERNMNICLDCGTKEEDWLTRVEKIDSKPIMADADGN